MDNRLISKLVHCTVRITTKTSNDMSKVGTGFYMAFLHNEKQSVPVIVTNRHVIEDAIIGYICFTLADNNGNPSFGKQYTFSIDDFSSQCILHPDRSVDLAVFPVGGLLNNAKNAGIEPFYQTLSMTLIPSQAERATYSTIEDVIMIGYPNGLWDSTNNLPVIRKGITATHPNINFNGKPEFLTDIASFGGSSGSPVFIYNEGGYLDNNGNMLIGQSRLSLIGVHYAGTQSNIRGEIVIVTEPNAAKPIASTNIPNNIGVVINSNKIIDLEHEVKRKLNM
ncbi:S1 family peptidase [Seleniivibrio woodruffii]|uniref:S1 family peptidase n=1 Tax=Seleniivibrio woodruffii TaxID=1078050 RepID=UPI0024097464|nr:serine protease [Seleniivibrio woodruffii]